MFDDPLVATLDKRVSFPPSKETKVHLQMRKLKSR